jgi:hypothetical protein
VDAHNGFTIFTHQEDRLVLNTFDDIEGSLPLVPEFLARFHVEHDFFYHGGTLYQKWSFLPICF